MANHSKDDRAKAEHVGRCRGWILARHIRRAFPRARRCSRSFTTSSTAEDSALTSAEYRRGWSTRTASPSRRGRARQALEGAEGPVPPRRRAIRCSRPSGPSGSAAHRRPSAASPPTCCSPSTIASWPTSAPSCSSRCFGARLPSFGSPTSSRSSSARSRTHPEVRGWSEETRLAVAQKYSASIRDFGLAKGTARKTTVRPALYGCAGSPACASASPGRRRTARSRARPRLSAARPRRDRGHRRAGRAEPHRRASLSDAGRRRRARRHGGALMESDVQGAARAHQGAAPSERRGEDRQLDPPDLSAGEGARLPRVPPRHLRARHRSRADSVPAARPHRVPVRRAERRGTWPTLQEDEFDDYRWMQQGLSKRAEAALQARLDGTGARRSPAGTSSSTRPSRCIPLVRYGEVLRGLRDVEARIVLAFPGEERGGKLHFMNQPDGGNYLAVKLFWR